MGTAVSVMTETTKIHQNFKTEVLNVTDATSTIQCQIEFKEISGKFRNCKVEFKNECYATSTGQIKSAGEMATHYWNKLSAEQKAQISMPFQTALNVNTSVTDIDTNIENIVNNYCKSKAAVNNMIYVDKMNVDCESVEPITFTFFNHGHAEANCLFDIVTRTSIEAVNDITKKQSTGFNLADFMWPVALVIVVLGSLLIFFRFRSTTKKKVSEGSNWASRMRLLSHGDA